MFLSEQQKAGIYLIKINTGESFKQISQELGCNYTLFINALNGKRELPDKYLFRLDELIRIKGQQK